MPRSDTDPVRVRVSPHHLRLHQPPAWPLSDIFAEDVVVKLRRIFTTMSARSVRRFAESRRATMMVARCPDAPRRAAENPWSPPTFVGIRAKGPGPLQHLQGRTGRSALGSESLQALRTK